jgi:hypothetical protein
MIFDSPFFHLAAVAAAVRALFLIFLAFVICFGNTTLVEDRQRTFQVSPQLPETIKSNL